MRTPLTLCCCLLSACHAAFAPLAAVPKANDARFAQSDSVVLLSEKTVRYFADPKTGEAQAEITTHWQEQLLRGSSFGPVRVYYSRTFSEAPRLEGRLLRPDGTQVELAAEAVRDAPISSGNRGFDDSRVVTWSPPSAAPGSVLEWRSVELDRDVKIGTSRFYFGSSVPLLEGRLTVVRPVGWEIGAKFLGDGAATPSSTSTDDGLRTEVWEVRDRPATEHETMGPSVWLRIPSVSVRLERWSENGAPKKALATPKELSAWLHQRYAEASPADPRVAATAAQVLAALPPTASAEDKARALYEHTCRSIQYCAIEIGYGGWVPHAPGAVQQNRYGDCKDKANYLRVLLSQAGIPSDVTLISAHDGHPQPFVQPSMGSSFNHAILRVNLGEKAIFADPTARTVPFGELPASDLDAPVLPLTAEGSDLLRTPDAPPEQSQELQRFDFTLAPDGRGVGTFTVRTTGAEAAWLKNSLLAGTVKREKLVERALDLDALQIDTLGEVRSPEFGAEATLNGTLKARGFLSTGTEVALLRLSDFAPRWLPALTEEAAARRSTLAWRYRSVTSGTFHLKLPPGATPTRVPPEVTVESPFARYALRWVVEGDALVIHRTLTRLQRTVAPADFARFEAFVDEVALADADPAVLHLAGGAK